MKNRGILSMGTRDTMRSLSILLALALIGATFCWLTDGVFLGPRNVSNLVRQSSVTGILAIGMVMVILTGEIDLSVGSVVALTGMTTVLAQTTLAMGHARNQEQPGKVARLGGTPICLP